MQSLYALAALPMACSKLSAKVASITRFSLVVPAPNAFSGVKNFHSALYKLGKASFPADAPYG